MGGQIIKHINLTSSLGRSLPAAGEHNLSPRLCLESLPLCNHFHWSFKRCFRSLLSTNDFISLLHCIPRQVEIGNRMIFYNLPFGSREKTSISPNVHSRLWGVSYILGLAVNGFPLCPQSLVLGKNMVISWHWVC